MSEKEREREEAEEIVDLLFSSLLSPELQKKGNLLDTLFLDAERVDNVFKKKEDYPTAQEVQDSYSKISNSNEYKSLMSDTLEGIKYYEKEKKEDEMVNHPDHYNQGPIETMEKFILMNHDRPDKIKGALEFNILKYTDRVGHKDATEKGIKEDNSKTQFYYDLYELLFPESIESIELYRVWKKSKK